MVEPPPPTSDTPPCGWEPITACCTGWCDFPPQIQDMALEVATDIVWRLSGLQFGLCSQIIRPCAQPCMGSSYAAAYAFTGDGYPGWGPTIIGGSWFNISCGCPGLCDCSEVGGVVLPPRAVSITQVLIDGEEVDSEDYALVNGSLVRTDGTGWPLCQDLAAPSTEVGTWEVTYVQGRAVPAGGNLAAGALACEIAKSCVGAKCRLPERVTDITREGVTMTLLDPQEFLTDGLTGIREVDAFLSAVNPFKQKSPAKVWSPDLPTWRRV